MAATITAAVAGFVIATISAGGYAGIAVLMAIESACIPLPSEVIMPFSGYLVSTGRFDLYLVATAGALGCNLGSAAAYWLGRAGGRPFIERWGHWLLISRRDLELADRFFARYGGIAVFVGRLLPIVRTFIALPAGIARQSQWRFHLYTFLGSWPWCFGLAYVGFALGARWDSDPRLRGFMHRFDDLVLAAIVLGALGFLWHHLRRNRR